MGRLSTLWATRRSGGRNLTGELGAIAVELWAYGLLWQLTSSIRPKEFGKTSSYGVSQGDEEDVVGRMPPDEDED